jgi:hypothetical protein
MRPAENTVIIGTRRCASPTNTRILQGQHTVLSTPKRFSRNFLNYAGIKAHNARRPGVSGDAAMITQSFVPPQRHNPLLLPDEFSPTKLK